MKISDKGIRTLGIIIPFLIYIPYSAIITYLHTSILSFIPAFIIYLIDLLISFSLYTIGCYYAERIITIRNDKHGLSFLEFISNLSTTISDYVKQLQQDSQYLYCFKIAKGEIKFLGAKTELDKIMEWYNSDIENYVINKPNGFANITKEGLIEFEYFPMPIYRIYLNKILHVVLNPLPQYLTVFSLIRILIVVLFGIGAYKYLLGQKLNILLLQNILYTSYTSLSTILVISYIFYGAYKAVLISKDGVNFPETMNIKKNFANSLAVNSILIFILPYIKPLISIFNN